MTDKLRNFHRSSNADKAISKLRSLITPKIMENDDSGKSSVEIAQSLHRSGSDEELFNKHFKLIGNHQAKEVAQYYVGSPKSSWKSHTHALNAIKDTFNMRRFADNRSKDNSKITPW